MASRETDKPLLLSAILGNIEFEVEDVVEDLKRSYYSALLYVADNKVAESTKSKPQSSVVKLEWKELERKANNQIWFEPSSSVKIELYRGYQYGNILKVLVGKHEGKVVNLLENDLSFDLTDKEGILTAKMKIALSCVSRSGDDIEEFMKMVDDDVGLMSRLPSNLSILGQVLKLTKAIMDQFSQVVHRSSSNLIIVPSSIYRTRSLQNRGTKILKRSASNRAGLAGRNLNLSLLLGVHTTTHQELEGPHVSLFFPRISFLVIFNHLLF